MKSEGFGKGTAAAPHGPSANGCATFGSFSRKAKAWKAHSSRRAIRLQSNHRPAVQNPAAGFGAFGVNHFADMVVSQRVRPLRVSIFGQQPAFQRRYNAGKFANSLTPAA